MKACFVALSALALAPSAQAKVIIDITPIEGQASRLQNGSEAILSTVGQSVVAIVENPEPTNKRTSLYIATHNSGDQPYNFGPENVFAMGRPASGEDVQISVLSHGELIKEQGRRNFWRKFGGALAAGASSTSAANSGNQMGTFSAHGNGQMVQGTYQYRDNAQAQAAQRQAQQDNREMMGNIEARNQAAISSINSNMRTTTVDPNGYFSGRVILELPKELRNVKQPTPAAILVEAGNDKHLFAVRILPEK